MSTPIARKELELRLTVTADPKRASAAMQQLARDAEKVEQAAGKANRALGGLDNLGHQFGGAAGSNILTHGRSAAGGGGGDSMSALAQIGPGVAAGVAAVAALAQFAARAGDSLAAFDNSLNTSRQAISELARAIPFIGEAVGRMADGLFRTIERSKDFEGSIALDQQRVLAPVHAAQRGAFVAGQDRRFALGRESASGEAMADAWGRYGTVEADWVRMRDRMGGSAAAGALLGPGAFAAPDPRLLPAAEAHRAALRTRAAATADAYAAARDTAAFTIRRGEAAAALDPLNREVERARAAAGAAGNRPGLWQTTKTLFTTPVAHGDAWGDIKQLFSQATNQAPYERALLDQQQAHQRLLVEQQRLEAAVTREKEAQLKLRRTDYEVSKAETEILRTRAQILGGKAQGLLEDEARVRGATRQFGALDEVSRRGVVDALGRFQAGGRDAVTAGEFQQLLSLGLTGEFVGKGLENDLKGDAGLAQVLKLTGQRDADTIAAERQRMAADVAKLQSEIAIKVEVNEKQFADVITGTMKMLNDDLTQLIYKIVDVQVKQIRNQFDLGNLQRGQ